MISIQGGIMEKKIFIEGMSCEHCVKRVKDTLKAIKKVKEVNVEVGMARVALKKDISDDFFTNVIEDLGYRVIKIE